MLRQPSIPNLRKIRTKNNNNEAHQTTHQESNQRVTIPSLHNMTGILRYVGQVHNKPGIWAGIELDTPEGKNDGTVQGRKYFSCPPNTGLFIAADKIIIHSPPSPIPQPNTPKVKTHKASITTPKTSFTPRPSSIIKPKSSRTFSPVKTSATPKTHTPRHSFTPKKATPRNSFTPTTTSKLSSTPKVNKRHSLNEAIQSRRSRTSIPIDPVPPLQIDSSSDTTTTSDTSTDMFHEATHQLYDMLEKTQRERDQLQHQIKTGEAAWERLVSSKESLSLQVQEHASEKQRLLRDLASAQSHVEQLELSLAERDASMAKKQREEEQQTQHQKRLERLEVLVRDLSHQLASAKEELVQERRAHAGEVEQMRRQVSVHEDTSAALEKECDELRRAGLEAIHAYEISVVQMKQQHESMMHQKTHHIRQLEMVVADLRQKQSSLFDDDERTMYLSDQRHRLEEQLELAMIELDRERDTINAMALEMEQVRLELTQQRQQNSTLEKRLALVQVEFEREVQDKKRLIEEADAAFELQAKAEDELYQLKLSRKAQDQAYHQLVVDHQQLERDYQFVMADSDVALKTKIEALEGENEVQRRNVITEKNKVQALSQDLAMLESLVENRVLDDTSLEAQLEKERSNVKYLQKELEAARTLRYNDLNNNNTNMYCEYCEKYNDHLTEDCPNQNETF